MIGPVCSLYPSHGGWEPHDAAGSRRGWVSGVVLVLAVAVLGVVLVRLVPLLGEDPALESRRMAGVVEGAGPPLSAVPGAGGGTEPWSWAQSTGAGGLEGTIDHAGGLLLVRLAHRGEGPFALEFLDGGPVVADVTGPYQGSRAFGLPPGTYRYRVAVAPGGLWGLAVEQPRYSQGTRLPRVLTGAGDTATRPFEVGAERTVRMSWTVEPDPPGARTAGEALHVRVLDVTGRVVAESVVADGDEVEQRLPAGRYLLDVSTGAGVWRVLLS